MESVSKTVVNYTGGEVVCSHGHVDFTVNILFVGGGSSPIILRKIFTESVDRQVRQWPDSGRRKPRET